MFQILFQKGYYNQIYFHFSGAALTTWKLSFCGFFWLMIWRNPQNYELIWSNFVGYFGFMKHYMCFTHVFHLIIYKAWFNEQYSPNIYIILFNWKPAKCKRKHSQFLGKSINSGGKPEIRQYCFLLGPVNMDQIDSRHGVRNTFRQQHVVYICYWIVGSGSKI